jgi:hypothetical protein
MPFDCPICKSPAQELPSIDGPPFAITTSKSPMPFYGALKNTPECNGRLRCVRQRRERIMGNGPLSEEAISDF